VIDDLARPHAAFPIECAALAARPAAVRKRALSLALDSLGWDHEGVHLDEIDALVRRPAHGQLAIDLPGGRLVRSYDLLVPDLAPNLVAGQAGGALRPPDGPYLVRPWSPGDRMRPARLRGKSKKLSDLFIDAKVPRAERTSARVVVRTTDGEIVWAEHLGLAFGEPAEVVPKPA